ncbi:hypothetical protein [Rufibacter psychrotolerans]|uniref:hypothetical protein n=1 Tax=Rufibacter psychrotolerans TaxID=2812556 RepID=UPI001967A93B|nr:hypothetical protein [Rufibacter sp. SYSU D00308]
MSITDIFGSVAITAFAAILAIAVNLFNIRDRYKKWKDGKQKSNFKKDYKEENPDFEFSLIDVSNPAPGKCILSSRILNKSKEVKYIESISYNFQFLDNRKDYEPNCFFVDGEKWPKRLENGERFHVSVDFSSSLINSLYRYWQYDVVVYAATRSTTGDLLRSNSISYNKLTNYLPPIEEKYKSLAMILSQKTGSHPRHIEATLWQLQIFNRVTSHIGKQLQQNQIPFEQYLIERHGLTPTIDPWYHWDKAIWEKNILPLEVEEYLKSIISTQIKFTS